ncbi:MAK10-like protein [Tanacetum coccineum]
MKKSHTTAGDGTTILCDGVWTSKRRRALPRCWDEEQEKAFQTLNDALCSAPILSLPDGSNDFIVYCDASVQGLDVPNASDHRLIELENQVQFFMEAHLAPKSSVQVNKIASSCEICSGPHDTQYFMENYEQAFVDYAYSLPTKREASGSLLNPSKTTLAINDRMTGALPSDTIKNSKLNVNPTSSVSSARSYQMAIQGGRIHKSNKKSLNAKGKGKWKSKGKDKNLLLKSTWQRMTLATTANRWGIGRGIVLLTLLS